MKDNGIEQRSEGALHWHLPSWTEAGVEHAFIGAGLDISSQDGREKWRRLFGAPRGIDDLLLLRQVHGASICDVRSAVLPEERPEADAAVARNPFDPAGASGGSSALGPAQAGRTRALGIVTADCFPVLFFDRAGKTVAAAHCGWRGASLGLLSRVIEALSPLAGHPTLSLQIESRRQNIEIAIGPGAQSCCYEVKEDVASVIWALFETGAFSAAALSTERAGQMLYRNAGRIFCSVSAVLRKQALAAGIPSQNVFSCDALCTICDGRFFSYRRDPASTSRELSFIAPPR